MLLAGAANGERSEFGSGNELGGAKPGAAANGARVPGGAERRDGVFERAIFRREARMLRDFFEGAGATAEDGEEGAMTVYL